MQSAINSLEQIQIVYTDDDVLVVNKPAGLLTIADGYDPTQPYLKKYLEEKYGPVWVVHRLDKLTSGIMVFARNAQAHRFVSLQFESRQVGKKYLCFCIGSPPWQTHDELSPLRVNADKKHRTLVDVAKGKPSKTSFSIINRFQFTSFIEAVPHSGYTHQIRSHLYFLGYPIIGDGLYGFKETRYQDRLPDSLRDGFHGFLMLCAKEITLTLPSDPSPRTFTIDLPIYFQDFANSQI